MNRRLWLRVGLGVFAPAVLLLELSAMASAQWGIRTFFWPLVAIAAVSLLAVFGTVMVQLVWSRFRFSLGSLLLAFAVFALILPLILGTLELMGRYRHIQRILAGASGYRTEVTAPVLQDLLGEDRILAFCEIKDLDANTQSGDEWIALLDNSLGLEALSLNNRTTDEGIARVSQLTTLRTLHVPGAIVTDTALNHLCKLPNLEVLWIDKRVTRFGFKDLARLPKLKTLHLAGPQLTHADLAGLVGLNNRLTGLFVWNCPLVTDVGVQHLAGLKSLESLQLLQCSIRGPGLAHLAKLPRLRKLSLNLSLMNDSALAHLKGCSSLRVLDLGYKGVTDAGLLHLENLPNLQEVTLNGTHVTESGNARLRMAMPSTIVYYRWKGPGSARGRSRP
jgi:Leucine-rich repeat (LRR) protein